MKNKINLFYYFLLLVLAPSIQAQSAEEEIRIFIKENKLTLSKQKIFPLKKEKPCDYYITDDSLMIGFDLKKIKKAGSKNSWKNREYKDGLEFLKRIPVGTSFHSDTLPMALEYLIYTYAIPNKKINSASIHKTALQKVKISIYTHGAKRRETLFLLQDENDHYLLFFSTTVCAHMRFR